MNPLSMEQSSRSSVTGDSLQTDSMQEARTDARYGCTAELSIRNHRSPMKCQASITTLTTEDRGDIMARTEEEGTTERTTTTEDPTSDFTTTIKTIITEEDAIIIKLGLLSVLVCF